MKLQYNVMGNIWFSGLLTVLGIPFTQGRIQVELHEATIAITEENGLSFKLNVRVKQGNNFLSASFDIAMKIEFEGNRLVLVSTDVKCDVQSGWSRIIVNYGVTRGLRNYLDRLPIPLPEGMSFTATNIEYHDLALCYKRKKTDLLRGDARGRGQEVKQLIRQPITLKSDFLLAKAELALLYGKNKEMFKTILKEAEEKTDMLQIIHHYCGEFHHYQNKSETQAVHHYTECMRLGQDTHYGKQSAYQLKKMASKRLIRDPSDGEALGILGFIHKIDR
ncbi:uncharacterized protein LOC121700567 [Alosa sapidissima]|uniref:uncharacterized protein LOC121700567 n=1 Tax=Alosa sapidissima TaxID=34773 RepID=UPI001C081C46|nr:uncharacterized protein LOC121700567 [Alosa sapidissima]